MTLARQDGYSSFTRNIRSSTSGVPWFTKIICDLRDDLAEEDPHRDLPRHSDIEVWVKDNFYPALLELTWEEAVLSLLWRMRRNAPYMKTLFAEVAMARLRKATQHSQIWRF